MMDRRAFQAYISTNMPITAPSGMDLRVERYDDDAVVISAPLGPNVNDKRTAFGGSIEVLLTLSAWGMAVRLLGDLEERPPVVIQRCTIEFLRPIADELRAVAVRPPAEEVARYIGMYRQFRKSRIWLRSSMTLPAGLAASFEGSFAAMGSGHYNASG